MVKARKQSSKQAVGTSDVGTTADESLLQSDIRTISEAGAAGDLPIPPRRRRRNEPEPVDIDRAYLANLPKMNFALLLALLMRERTGQVTLKQRDLQRADDEQHSILFALSLDGTELKVSVVSTESGIIRSPEATLWAQTENAARLQPATTYQTPPPPPPEPTAEELRQQAAGIVEDWQRALNNAGLPQPADQQPRSLVEMPNPAKPKSPEMLFPFEVGTSPQTAHQVTNLSQIQTELAKDQKIEQQEQEAAARVGAGSA